MDDTSRINPPAEQKHSSGPESKAPSSTQPSTSTGPGEVDTKQGHDYTFLTHKMFKINGAFVPGKDPKDKPYQNQWIDLEPDGTYTWGEGKNKLYTGFWGYNHDLGIIDLLPKDKNQKQTEWKVIFNDDMVVFTGTKAFDNNGIQLQLIRVASMD